MKWKAIDLGIWHTSASIIIPTVTIHSVVKITSYGITKFSSKNIKMPGFYRFIPSIIGLAFIPIIINPIDNITDYIMDNSVRKFIPQINEKCNS